jgi:hypothetical protein
MEFSQKTSRPEYNNMSILVHTFTRQFCQTAIPRFTCQLENLVAHGAHGRPVFVSDPVCSDIKHYDLFVRNSDILVVYEFSYIQLKKRAYFFQLVDVESQHLLVLSKLD